jgi:predicted ArsR family transcriptional regulator
MHNTYIGRVTVNSSMTVTNTSLKAYYDIKASGKLGRRQYQVLENLRYLKEATNTEVSVEARLPINQVTPRMLELRKSGLVVQASQRKCGITGRTAKTWRVADWTHVRKE